MTCAVKVTNGAIPLPPGVELPDGSEVQVIVPDAVGHPASFADRYAAYIGAADDLPADLAANIDHYVHRHSRKWLTDCTSFVVMRDGNITDAPTGDHHFEQPGFKALLV